MKKTDTVFQLVKSLSRGEKRNFRLMSQLTAGDKKYLKLFDAIDKQEVYDEAKILKSFRKDAAFVRQFSYNKNYLYNAILNSLSYFHKGSHSELSSLSLQVRILMDKNLFQQAKKLLRKAKEKVKKQEKFEDLLQLLDLEIDIIKHTTNLKLLEESIYQAEWERKFTLEQLMNLQEYQRLENRSFIFAEKAPIARNENELAEIKGFEASELLEDDRAQSIRASLLRCSILYRVSFYKGDYASAKEYATTGASYIENNPDLLEDFKTTYIKFLSSVVTFCFLDQDFDNAFPVLHKIQKVKVVTPRERVVRFNRYFLILLSLSNDNGGGWDTEKIIQNIISELQYLQNDLSDGQRYLSTFLIAVHYISVGDYETALSWLNKFIRQPITNFRTDVQAMVRLLYLVVNLELGNHIHVDYSIKSTYRFIYKRERMYKVERRILNMVRQSLNARNEQEQLAIYKSTLADIERITEDAFEQRALNVFDFQSWLEAKIRGVEMAQIKKEDAIIKQSKQLFELA